MINSIGEINRRPITSKVVRNWDTTNTGGNSPWDLSDTGITYSKSNLYAIQFLVLVIGTFVGFWGTALFLVPFLH